MKSTVVVWMCLAPLPACAAVVRGRVADSATGEALARVEVRLSGTAYRAESGPDGRFSLGDVAPGEYQFQASTVGYRTVREPLSLDDSGERVMEISLVPETLRRSEQVQVSAGPFPETAPLAEGLAGNELRNLASVLADDPMRAVQGLPGVTTSGDFQSQFAVRGAGFDRVGLYLDGVLLHAPFHSVRGDPNSASITMFNGDALDSVDLFLSAPPPRYADRTAGALDMRSRAGDRRKVSGHLSASASNVAGLAEGPVGKAGKGAWLVAARKSYLQYIINLTSDEPALAFGFTDVQARADYDLTPAWNVSLGAVQGGSGLDRTEARDQVGLNTIVTSDYRFTLVNLAARYAPGGSFLVTNRVAYLRERFRDENRANLPLSGEAYGEWIWNADGSAAAGGTLEFGSSVRRLRDDGFVYQLLSGGQFRRDLDRFAGTGWRSGGYLQQAWTLGRIHLAIVYHSEAP